jgi:hypothetical protein
MQKCKFFVLRLNKSQLYLKKEARPLALCLENIQFLESMVSISLWILAFPQPFSHLGV